MSIKAITLHQPWATLIALSLKQYETRSWSTPYRGQLAIHAAQTTTGISMLGAEQFSTFDMGQSIDRFPLFKFIYRNRELLAPGGGKVQFPLGAVLCTVDLVDCILMTPELIASMSEQERAFGLWRPGRYAWKLENLRPLPVPVPCKGWQRLWNWQP